MYAWCAPGKISTGEGGEQDVTGPFGSVAEPSSTAHCVVLNPAFGHSDFRFEPLAPMRAPVIGGSSLGSWEDLQRET